MDRNTVILLVFMCVMLTLAYYASRQKPVEGFDFDLGTTNSKDQFMSDVINPMEKSQNDVDNNLFLINRDTGSIAAASEFMGMPDVIIPPWGGAILGASDDLDDGDNGSLTTAHAMCSKSCCAQQYPPSFSQDQDSEVCKSKSKFIGNSYTCNNSYQDSGCVCMNEKQFDYLSHRGGNA